MTNEELQEEIKRLEEQLTELRFKISKSKVDDKPYKVEVPEDIEDYYFLDETGNIVYKALYSSNYQKKTFIHGLAFKTKEEAEQHDKERILLFKMHKWAEEHNGDWYPDWNNGDDKFSIYYFHNTESFSVCSDWNCNSFSELPYFKSEELAREFIEEFGDEIKEVLC